MESYKDNSYEENIESIESAVEGIREKPRRGKGSVLVLFLFWVVAIVCVLYMRRNITYDKTENQGYENVLIQYDENYGETGTSEDLVFPYENTERDCAAHTWARYVTAIYAYLEDGDVDQLGGHARVWDSWIEEEEFLDKAWEITDRASAIEKIDNHITYGHQASCRAYIQQNKDVRKAIEAIEQDYGKEFNYMDALNITEDYFEDHNISTKHFYRTKGAACAYVRFGENALAAYDYMRLIRVINMCNDCRWLSDDEYMSLIYNMDVALQQKYDSFEDIHECYYYGEMFRLDQKSDYADGTIYDIVSALDSMKADRFYVSADKHFNDPLSEDWLDLMVKRKDL